MRQKLRQETGRPSTGQHLLGATSRERQSDLLGAEPGPGPGRAHNGTLQFTVSDDGTGYDARHTPMGSGLRNMADRLAALGGQLQIRSAPSRGTIITGYLPAPVTSSGISAQHSHPAQATTA
jgi:hypothetical protein